MQGYFSYTLFGTQEELKKADEKIKELAKTNKEFEDLEYFNCGVVKKDEEDAVTSLTYEMPESGNISGISFDFNCMMGDLSEMFKDLAIEGTGYLLDYPPYETWNSEKGESTYEINCETEYREIYISKEEVLDENNNFITDVIEYETEDEILFDIPINEDVINKENLLNHGYEEFCITIESSDPAYEPDYQLTVIIE